MSPSTRARPVIGRRGVGTDAGGDGRDRVLGRAHALFIERGFDGVSMQQVADAAGMTKAALYYHFRDKEDLFAHVMRREMERVGEALAAALKEDGTLRHQLRRVAEEFFASITSDLGRLVADLKRHVSPARRAAIGCEPAPPYGLLRPRFEQAVAAGEIRADLDLDLVVSLFFGMIFSQLREAKLEGPAPPPAAVAAAIVDVLLDGVGAGPRSDPAGVRPTRAAATKE